MIGNALIHFVKCYLGLEHPHTQTTKLEQAAIAKYSKDAQKCVEIGVYEGVNTVIIAEQLSSGGLLYAIDPFFKGKLGFCYHEKIAKNLLVKNKLSNNVNLIKKLSFDASEEIPDDIDFMFVDGDHSIEGIKKDWELYAIKIKPDGFIALHDTSIPAHDGSVSELGSYKYFNSHIKYDKRFSIVETVDSLNILKKK
jgi:predicted O-methyltransferase YrrM